MKIIFISRLFYPHIGGVEKHVLRLSQLLVNKGHEVTVITEQYDFRLKKKEFVDGINILRVPVGGEFVKKFKIWSWLLVNFSVLYKSDIVHCHDVFYWYLPFRFLLPWKKVYVTFHGYEGDSLPSWKAKLSHKIAELLSHGNICVGDYLVKWYGTKPTYITYGAADAVRGRNIKPARNTAVFIGRLESEANIMNYLKALKELKSKNITLKLSVFGDGSLRNEAEKYAVDNNLNVIFLGFVNDAYKYIYKYEYVFTSRFLGTLEGMSSGRMVFVIFNNLILKDCFYMAPFKKAISINGSYRDLVFNFRKYSINKEIQEKKIRLGYNWVAQQTWLKMVSTYLKLWNE